jgi:flagellar motor component MotA
MKQRFFFSIIFVASTFCLVTWISGGSLYSLFDIPSLFIVGILPFLFQLIFFGFKNFKNAFSSPLKENCSIAELSRSLDFFKSYKQFVWTCSLAAVGISLVTVFTYLDNPQALGPNLAVALLSLLYAALIYLLLILPYIAIIKQRFSESNLEI